jgi:hypothetical protein
VQKFTERGIQVQISEKEGDADGNCMSTFKKNGAFDQGRQMQVMNKEIDSPREAGMKPSLCMV